MRLEDYANSRGMSVETARAVLTRPEAAGSLKGHVTDTPDGTELDEDAVSVLDEYIGYREGETVPRRRTADAGSPKGPKELKPRTAMIVVTVVVFALLITAFILRETGVVNKWVAAVIILSITAGVAIFYLIEKRKER